MSRYAGIDLGTSWVRAAVIDDDCRLLAQSRRPLRHGDSGPADPEAWLRAVTDLLEEVDPVSAFAIGGQMNGFVPVDESGRALGQGLTWLDRRLIVRSADACPAAPVVRYAEYLQVEEPEVWTRARWLLLPKDYVLMALIGQPASDRLSWNSVAHPRSGVLKPGLASEIAERLPTLDEMTASFECSWGRAVIGCPDSVASLIGCGIDRTNVYLIGGTSTTAGAFAIDEQTSRGIRAAVPLDEDWVHFGSSSSGGATIDWAAQVLGFADVKLLLKSASGAARQGAPLFVPYLTGERAPIWDESLTASWVDVRAAHDRSSLAYAALESVVFVAVRLADAVIGSSGATVSMLRASGGTLRGPLVRALCRSAFSEPIGFVEGEVGALGAALVALAGARAAKLRDVAADVGGKPDLAEPIADPVVRERYERWSDLAAAAAHTADQPPSTDKSAPVM